MTENDSLLSTTLRGGLLVFGFVVAQYFFGFLIQIILARILEPEHFGTLAFSMMVAMFFQRICNTNGDKYIIKEKNDIYKKLDSVFTIEFSITLFFIGFVLLLAPFLMNLLDKPDQTIYVQVLTVSFLYSPFSKPISLFEKDLSFFKARYPKLVSQIAGGAIGIIMAINDFGVWSLITWKVSTFLLENVITWSIIEYRPRFRIDYALIKEITFYSWPLMASGILVFFYNHIDYYYVGRLLGEEQLGFYWLAFQSSHYFLSIKSSIISVVFPSFAKIDNTHKVKLGFEVLTKTTMYIYMLPTIVVLALGKDLIILIFGSKWAPATTAFQIFMLVTMLRAVTSFWDPVFLLFGKTKVLFTLTIFNSLIISILGYIFTINFGILGMSSTVLLTMLLIMPIAGARLKELIDTSYFHILKKPIAYFVVLTAGYHTLYSILSKHTQSTLIAIGLPSVLLISIYAFVIFYENKTIFRELIRRL